MKNILHVVVLGLLSAPLLLTSCKKAEDDYKLEGPVPQSSFTYAVNTTEYPVVVTYTATSQDGFVYQWKFGDNSLGSGATVTHTYARGGTYDVELITGGRGGTGISKKQTVVVPDGCADATFSKLVDCAGSGIRVWSLSGDAGAIVTLDASGKQLSASTTLNDCQLDDQFAFSNSYSVNYESAGQTFQNGTCGSSLNNASAFVYRPNPSGNPQIVLKGDNSFLGTADPVVNKTYDILEVTDAKLRLRGTNPDGTFTVVTFTPYDATAPVKRLLTGGSSKTWKLDNAADAAITVGTEAEPTKYYAGGAANSLPDCQADDEYTFSVDNILSYDAKGQTLSVQKGRVCSDPETGTTPYTFGPAAGTGKAQLKLARKGAFIGPTDASVDEQIYRILSIDDKHMVVRAGSGLNGGTVFDIKMIAK